MTRAGARATRDVVAEAVAAFLSSEVAGIAPAATASSEVTVAAIGTTAPRAVHSGQLAAAVAAEGLTIADADVRADPAALLAARDWDLAVVLSPFKRATAALVGRTGPAAAASGVVDTVLAAGDRTLGLNTNSWGITAVLRLLGPTAVTTGAGAPTVLVLGAGASVRSAIVAVGRTAPDARVVVSGRDGAAARELAARFGVEAVEPADVADVAPDLVVNATTWGETDESEQRPFAFPFGDLVAPGRTYFDMNNRRSRLLEQALDAGCVAMSGTVMQVVTHACRAAAVRWWLEGDNT